MIKLSNKTIFYFGRRWIQKVKRPPVVTIMGHVDHGKTTLLDHLRNSRIAEQEFGGITQQIGAFVVPFRSGSTITFLDTPGHAAFAAMRQRSVNITDLVVLVVACDRGVLEQTIESIDYARECNVPIIVAVNKVDKYSDKKELAKNIDSLKTQLRVHGIITEDDGGDVQIVKISALQGIGINDLKEAILALAETLELEVEVDCSVVGRVIKSQVHENHGKLCTILVQKGLIFKGVNITGGPYNWAKVRSLIDEHGRIRQSSGPGLPIQVTGWREEDLPVAGDLVLGVKDEKEAKSIVHQNRQARVVKKVENDAKVYFEKADEHNKDYKERLAVKQSDRAKRYQRILFNERGVKPKESVEDEFADRKINLVLKCDLDISLGAITDLLDTYDKDNKKFVKLDILHSGVGPITDSDYTLASSFPNSVIYGFNVKLANQKLLVKAKQDGVSLKLFNVIYHLIDDLKSRISEKIPELEKEVELGQANVIQEFIVTETNKEKTRVAGCRCSRGSLKRTLLYKLVRNKEVIVQDLQVKTLKHLKDDVKEVEKDRECGISFLKQEGLEYEFKPGDQLIAYEKQKYKPRLKWDLKGFASS